MSQGPEWARSLAEHLLAEALPRRWAHTHAVAAQARALASGILTEPEIDLVVSAAWLHDIGYAPGIAATGFHPLDGARYLQQDWGVDPALCYLVAHHTGAACEAEERGLAKELEDFGAVQHEGRLLRFLTAADLTRGPDGSAISPENRIHEILDRYSPEDPVHRAVLRSGPTLTAVALQVLAEAAQSWG